MPKRAPNLQLRGSIYWLRVRVPDDLRSSIGKTEVTKSLGTRDYREATLLARVERVKLDAEWGALRRRVKPATAPQTSEIDVWRLVSKWFVDAEKKRDAVGPTALDHEGAQVELHHLRTWEDAAPQVFEEAKRLLVQEGLWASLPAPADLAARVAQEGQEAEQLS